LGLDVGAYARPEYTRKVDDESKARRPALRGRESDEGALPRNVGNCREARAKAYRWRSSMSTGNTRPVVAVEGKSGSPSRTNRGTGRSTFRCLKGIPLLGHSRILAAAAIVPARHRAGCSSHQTDLASQGLQVWHFQVRVGLGGGRRSRACLVVPPVDPHG